MKANHFISVLMGVVLTAVSCQREELTGGMVSGEEVSVGVSAVMSPDGGAVTRSNDAPGNASEINRCILGIYLSDNGNISADSPIGGLRTVPVENKKADFGDVRLVSGHTYQLVFWADCAKDESGTLSDNHYSTAGFPEVAFAEGDTYSGNDDTRDAFFASETITVDGPGDYSISLSRPFGQLNIITTDYSEVGTNFSQMLPEKVKIAFGKIYSGIDLLTGKLSDDGVLETLTSGPVAVAGVTDPAQTDGAKQLSFDYIFAPDDGQLILDAFTMSFLNAADQSVVPDYTFENIPVQRNYRTNVSGDLLTDRAGLKVEIDSEFDEAETKLREVFEQGGTYTLAEDVAVTEALKLDGNKEVTINLNGFDIINETSIEDSSDPRYGNTTVFEVSGNSVLNIEGDGNVQAIGTVDGEDGYRMAVYALGNATVNIYGGNFLNDQKYNAQLDLIYADQSAVINIYGGTFESKCCNSNNVYWVLNLKDGSDAAINVYGGTFVNFDPSSSYTENPVMDFVAEGYTCVKLYDDPQPYGTYKVGENAVIEDNSSFINALQDNSVTEISVTSNLDLQNASQEDLTFSEPKIIDIAEDATIKLGENNYFVANNGLTLTGGGTVDNTSATSNPSGPNPGYQKSLVHVYGGELVIDGVTLINDVNHHWHGSQFNSAAIAYWNDTDVTIRNATVRSGEFTVCGMGRGVASGVITIEGGTFESTSSNANNGNHWAYAMRLFGSRIRLSGCTVLGIQGAVSIEGCTDAVISSGTYETVNSEGKDAFYPLYITNGAQVTIEGGDFSSPNDRSGGLEIDGTSTVVSGDNDTGMPVGSVVLKGGRFSGKAYNSVTKEVYEPAEGYKYQLTGDSSPYKYKVVPE